MKTKITIAALLSVLFINAAPAENPVKGNVGAGYVSDYHRRGAQLSNEAIQAQVGFNVGVGGVDVFGDFHTNQATEGSVDTNEFTIGFGTDLFEDKVNAFAGIYNTDLSNADNDLEAFVTLNVDTMLSPSVTLYRDTDDDLYTFEGTLSHTFELGFADLELAGILGNTDSTASVDYTYSGAKVTLSKTINNVNLYTNVGITDTENRDNSTVWGVGLNVKF